MLVPLDHSVARVAFAKTELEVELCDGRRVHAPLEWFPMLAKATPEQRRRFTVDGDGVSVFWPELGEVVSTVMLLSKRK